MNKTAIILVNYNMPEYADALIEYITLTVNCSYDLIVVDNGSDLVSPSKYTTLQLPENIQMVPGFLAGWEITDSIGIDYYAYWMLTTSCRFDSGDKRDPLDVLLKVLEGDEQAYAVQPSLIFNYGAWERYLLPRHVPIPRRIFALENVCPLFRAKHFDDLGRINEKLTYGWGFSAEMYWKARKAGLRIYTHDGYVMFKDTEIGYTMDRMDMGAEERRELASQQSKDVLLPIYGEDYLDRLNYEYRELGIHGEY